MVVSTNPEPSKAEFEKLLDETIDELRYIAKIDSKRLHGIRGTDFEPFVKDVMSDKAIGTNFENSINLISGHKFPDIVASRYYGVEVKTTDKDHWKSTGNSVLESTRIETVERIYMLFAKLSNDIDFRYRPYEDVLSEIVVTHSPRYRIDMELKQGETIFDKMKIPYDDLRKDSNPIRHVVNYYKDTLRKGDDMWWIDTDSGGVSSVVIRIWKNLSSIERKQLQNTSVVLFPELLSNSNDKYSRLAIWLVKHKSIVCPNIRDSFSAGGKCIYQINGRTFRNVPRVFKNILDNIDDIKNIIINTDVDILTEYWNFYTSNQSKFQDWIDLVSIQSKKIQDAKHLDLKDMILLKIQFAK